MRRFTALVFPALAAILIGAATIAQTAETAEPVEGAVERWRADPTVVFAASEIDLEEFLWIARPIVVFAQTPADPAFIEQLGLLAARPETLADRDVLLVTDTDPKNPSDIRLKLRPRGFMLVLLDKDGAVNLRKPMPWSTREISRSIDKMPIRQQEISEQSSLK